jgi:hypothetical protein
MWQTVVRNGASVTWGDYLASVRGDAGAPPGPGTRFWKHQDPRRHLPLWERRVPRERIHVVTVPPSGSDRTLLWRRFCEVLQVDPEVFTLDVRRTNESLGTAESELLRRLNTEISGRVHPATYESWVKLFAARQVLERREHQHGFGLPEEDLGWVRARAAEIAGFLGDEGYRVVGDLTDLDPRPSGTGAASPDDADPAEMLDAAVALLGGLLLKLDRQGDVPDGVAAKRRGLSGDVRGRAAPGRRTGPRARLRTRR